MCDEKALSALSRGSWCRHSTQTLIKHIYNRHLHWIRGRSSCELTVSWHLLASRSNSHRFQLFELESRREAGKATDWAKTYPKESIQRICYFERATNAEPKFFWHLFSVHYRSPCDILTRSKIKFLECYSNIFSTSGRLKNFLWFKM